MEKIQIDRVKETDKPYIKEKLKNYILDTTNLEWDRFFVARKADKPVAFARTIDHGEFFEFASLGVDYYHREQGIGVKMLKVLIKEAKRLDPKKPIYGVTHRPGFLEKVGFIEVETGPAPLEHKKYHRCILPPSKIKIMKLA